jgi:anaerobic C4-dicarboxylate transporter
MASYNYGNTARKEYIHGNAVRKRDLERERLEQEKQQKLNKKAQQQLKAAKKQHAKSVLFLSFAVVITLIACIGYVKLQSDATQNLKKIANMKAALCNMEQENNMIHNNIVTNIDLVEIKEIAITQLGMSYPTKEQIIEIDVSEHENFMDVYADPEDFQ